MAGRLRSGISLLRRTITLDNASIAKRSLVVKPVLCPTISSQEFARNYASAPPANEQKVKVPVKLYGVSGNYASALYIATVKANALDKPLPPGEEKELKETLQEIFGQGKKVKLEQKIYPSILVGLVVKFSQNVFDMSIKTRAAQMERFLRQPINLDGN